MEYVEQQFEKAIRTLVIGQGDIRSRLLMVCEDFYSLQDRNFSDFSAEIKEDWEWIYRQLHRWEPEYKEDGSVRNGSVEVTLKKIKNKTGSNIAKRIYDLRYKIKKFNKPNKF